MDEQLIIQVMVDDRKPSNICLSFAIMSIIRIWRLKMPFWAEDYYDDVISIFQYFVAWAVDYSDHDKENKELFVTVNNS